MLNQRTVIHIALILAFSVSAHANVQGLAGTMLSPEHKGLLSDAGQVNMEAARDKVLNEDTEQEITWEDSKNDISGVFQITNRFKIKNTETRCREYTHVLRNRAGTPIPLKSTGRPVKVRDLVCFDNAAWAKYKGDRNLLNPESANGQPAASGPTGPEHRRQHPNMVGPVALGQILDGYKLFRKNIEAQESKEVQDLVREQMYQWTKKIADQMIENNKTMALDQLVILLGEVKLDSVKFKVVELLRYRLDVRVGKVSDVKALFVSNARKAAIEKLLRN